MTKLFNYSYVSKYTLKYLLRVQRHLAESGVRVFKLRYGKIFTFTNVFLVIDCKINYRITFLLRDITKRRNIETTNTYKHVFKILFCNFFLL